MHWWKKHLNTSSTCKAKYLNQTICGSFTTAKVTTFHWRVSNGHWWIYFSLIITPRTFGLSILGLKTSAAGLDLLCSPLENDLLVRLKFQCRVTCQRCWPLILIFPRVRAVLAIMYWTCPSRLWEDKRCLVSKLTPSRLWSTGVLTMVWWRRL